MERCSRCICLRLNSQETEANKKVVVDEKYLPALHAAMTRHAAVAAVAEYACASLMNLSIEG